MAGKSSTGTSMDLAQLFGVAAQALASNQAALNKADTNNGDHGDNMVQIFNLVTQALASQAKATPTEQLAHASQVLSQKATSGSSQVYVQGLDQAAKQLQGQKTLTAENALTLVQTLLGGEQAAGTGADLLGALMGGSTPSGAQGTDDGLDVGDLLNAGLAFMSAKGQGQDNLQALMSALVSNGPLGQRSHRQQSGEIVANALLQAIASATSK